MGRTKQLLPIDGRPVLSHVIAAALGSQVDEVVVVLGHEAAAIRDALGPVDGVRFVDNPDYGSGQASSLAAGLDALDAHSRAAVVLLGDQPTVAPTDIDRVASEFLAADAIAARAAYSWSGETVEGHPTVLDRRLWDEVREVEGDLGARDVLARHTREVVRVRFEKPPPADLDTLVEYRALVDPP